MIIENYKQIYEDEIVNLWNNCLIVDPITVERFREKTLLDENFDSKLAWVAKEENKIIGFAYATKRIFPYLERGLEENRGWINVIFVRQDFRKKGIGTALYQKCENALKEKGVKNITLAAYSPNYYFSGVDPDNYPDSISFFEKKGYKSIEEHYSMGMDLHGYQISKEIKEKKNKLEEEGYEFIHFEYKYCLELLDFLKEEFGGGWKRNALIAMQNNTAEETIILVLNPDKEICGFCMSAIDGNPMRFGPIGISSKQRDKGLGSILLDVKRYEMAKQGIYHMFFMSTEKNARRYYERNGLKVIRRFIDYRKNL